LASEDKYWALAALPVPSKRLPQSKKIKTHNEEASIQWKSMCKIKWAIKLK
jgi:hypothetical protein